MSSQKLCIFLLMVLSTIASQIKGSKSLAVTVYNDQFAMVKDVREITFDKGTSDLYFLDVASKIETETVTFRALNETQNIKVYEQNFEDNLINIEAILKKYINQKLDVYATMGGTSKKITGTLLGYNSGYILSTPNGIQQVKNVDGVTLPTLPEGFFTLPTLNWKVTSLNAVTVPCEVAYRTTGFSWKSDYSLIVNELQTRADLGGWVTIENRSGKRYENVKLKLVAGQVNTVDKTPQVRPTFRIASAMPFQSTDLSDYHLYTLNQLVTIGDNSQKQVEFIPKVFDIAIRKYNLISVNAGGYEETNLKALNKIDIRNTQLNKLGFPFPKGTMRVFKPDSNDGSLQFIGEQNIEHTPKDENITITTGNAFDIAIVKTVVNKTNFNNNTGYEANIIVSITNHKNITVDLVFELTKQTDTRQVITWSDPQLKAETISASLLRIKKTLAADQKWSIPWNEIYRY